MKLKLEKVMHKCCENHQKWRQNGYPNHQKFNNKSTWISNLFTFCQQIDNIRPRLDFIVFYSVKKAMVRVVRWTGWFQESDGDVGRECPEEVRSSYGDSAGKQQKTITTHYHHFQTYKTPPLNLTRTDVPEGTVRILLFLTHGPQLDPVANPQMKENVYWKLWKHIT